MTSLTAKNEMILAEREKYARWQAENMPNIRHPAPKQGKG